MTEATQAPRLNDLLPSSPTPPPPPDPELTPVNTRIRKAKPQPRPSPTATLSRAFVAQPGDQAQAREVTDALARMMELWPHIKLRVHPTAVQMLLKNICESSYRFLPNYTQWRLPHDERARIVHRIWERLQTRAFFEQQYPKMCMLLGPSVANLQWATSVYVSIGVYAVLDELVAITYADPLSE